MNKKSKGDITIVRPNINSTIANAQLLLGLKVFGITQTSTREKTVIVHGTLIEIELPLISKSIFTIRGNNSSIEFACSHIALEFEELEPTIKQFPEKPIIDEP